VLAGRRRAIAQAEEAVEAAEAAVAAARRERDTAATEAQEARGALGTVATEVATIAGGLDVEVAVAADPDVLDAALRRVREAWVEASQAADAAITSARAEEAEAAEQRGVLMEGIGLDPEADFTAAVAGARHDLAGVAARIEVLGGRLEDLERLEAQEHGTIEQHTVLEHLHGDLAPSRFQAFVLDEYRRSLSDLGSEQFEVLSGGRYRFSSDGEFDVIDLMAAEQTRAADSLSGGETFLASLALALALAEMVARQGGRLDAFFLDEGFGSLDAEHLDLAMEGIERLVAGADRLVVVVSHVAALQDRIEDLITLDKDPLTGVTRVRSGAGR
jgi:exonuclease SbcC